MDVLEFAKLAHKGQKYGDGDYFEDHVLKVVEVARSYLDDEDVIKVAALHDVIEDADVTWTHIEELYGTDVADAVGLLTDPTGDGWSRKEKKQALYARFKIARDLYDFWPIILASIVKLSDRIVNHEKSLADNNIHKMTMYVREFPEFFLTFYAPLAEDNEHQELGIRLINQFQKMSERVRVYG